MKGCKKKKILVIAIALFVMINLLVEKKVYAFEISDIEIPEINLENLNNVSLDIDWKNLDFEKEDFKIPNIELDNLDINNKKIELPKTDLNINLNDLGSAELEIKKLPILEDKQYKIPELNIDTKFLNDLIYDTKINIAEPSISINYDHNIDIPFHFDYDGNFIKCKIDTDFNRKRNILFDLTNTKKNIDSFPVPQPIQYDPEKYREFFKDFLDNLENSVKDKENTNSNIDDLNTSMKDFWAIPGLENNYNSALTSYNTTIPQTGDNIVWDYIILIVASIGLIYSIRCVRKMK